MIIFQCQVQHTTTRYHYIRDFPIMPSKLKRILINIIKHNIIKEQQRKKLNTEECVGVVDGDEVGYFMLKVLI